MAKALVIIPTFNEIENIEKITRAVMGLEFPFHLLVIDDGSPDKTAEKVKELQAEFPNRLFLEQRNNKSGLGTAYIHGFRYALARGYEYILEMDADFSHDPNDLIRLLDTCRHGGYDMSVGSRYVSGGKLVNWPLFRLFISRGASIYTRIVLLMNIKDATAGFVCYKAEVLDTIDLDKIKFVGYAFQVEMKFAAYELNFKIKEIPITFKDRTEGTSKMSTRIFKEAFWGVIQMRWRGFFSSYARNKS